MQAPHPTPRNAMLKDFMEFYQIPTEEPAIDRLLRAQSSMMRDIAKLEASTICLKYEIASLRVRLENQHRACVAANSRCQDISPAPPQ
jgi:hypothetical protein